MDGDDDGPAGAQRHRVVRGVHDLRVDGLGDQRQAGLLPGEAGGAVRDRGRAGDDGGGRRHPAVPLGVGALAHDGQVGAPAGERRDEAVDVPPDAAAVGGDGGRVDEDAGTARSSRAGGHATAPLEGWG